MMGIFYTFCSSQISVINEEARATPYREYGTEIVKGIGQITGEVVHSCLFSSQT